MDKKTTGGPAFPESYGDPRNPGWIGWGMTLRDYFAAKAMQGVIAQSQGSALASKCVHAAKYAYEMADAMLSERNK